MYDSVPGVWPGVATMSTVVSPSESFIPSGPTDTSRVGTPPAALAGRCSVVSQSGAPMTTFAPKRFCSSAAP
jgi:hypothetical protein